MPFLTEHKRKFDDLRAALEQGNRSQLKREANGGNTILFSYKPEEEQLYINKALELFPEHYLIDISEIIVKAIDAVGLNEFKEYYTDFINTPDQVFKNDDPSSFFMIIIEEIQKAADSGKMPFIIRTGVLFGTGVDNVNIMENNAVMNSKHPVVIFYPSSYQQDNLLFLNFKQASKYRCKLIK